MAVIPHYADAGVTLHHGDCLDVLRQLPDASVDAVVTDPPYGIAFMGKAWDQPGQYGSTTRNGTPAKAHREGNDGAGAMDAGRYDLSPSAMVNFQRWCEVWATECLRILKPGGHLLAFGGSRTWHRLAAGIEDAGFEMRDSIAWLYGSGFPKSLDVSKAIDKAAGAERDVVGEQSDHLRSGRYASGPAGFSTERGTSLVDRVGPAVTDEARRWEGWGTALKPGFEPCVVARKPLDGTVAANVLAHGTGALNIDGCRIGEGDRPLVVSNRRDGNEVYGDGLHGSRAVPGGTTLGRWPANVLLDESQAAALDEQTGTLTSGKMQPTHTTAGRSVYGQDAAGGFTTMETYGDSGGASRFFYVAKASRRERPVVDGVAHPTVKPLTLMRWLVRLVTPPGGVVLEPFAGSGTTVEACVREGFQCVAIEREADYLPLILRRLDAPTPEEVDNTVEPVDDDEPDADLVAELAPMFVDDQSSIFDFIERTG